MTMPKSILFLLLGAWALGGCGSESIWKSQNFALASPPDSSSSAGGAKTNIVTLRRVTVSPLFQARSFTYRTGENAYEHDPYASFFVSPERALEEPIRDWLRDGGAFGCVTEPGSGLTPSLAAEVSITELYGDFRKQDHPTGDLEIHFILYEVNRDGPGRILLDKIYAHQTSMAKAAPAALAAAWDADLRAIMGEINSALAQLPLN